MTSLLLKPSPSHLCNTHACTRHAHHHPCAHITYLLPKLFKHSLRSRETLACLKDKQSVRQGSCSQRGPRLPRKTDRQIAGRNSDKGPSKGVWPSVVRGQLCRLMPCAHIMGKMDATLGQSVPVMGFLNGFFMSSFLGVMDSSPSSWYIAHHQEG